LPLKLSGKLLKALEPPASGYYLIWDSGIKGFGVRITTAGAKSFIYNYRVRETGRERRKTIGQYPAWSVAAAKKEAERLKQLRDQGHDPMGELHAKRGAPTVADLADFYCEHHLPTLRPSSQRDARDMLRDHILPRLGKIKVANVKQSDVAALHRRMSTIPYRANRVLAVVSKMFNIAEHPDQGWREPGTSPVRGVKRYSEEARERFLSAKELDRLTEALRDYPDQTIANAIRLILLTGARKSEVLTVTWDQFDFERGAWTKPSHHTKQKRRHTVPLSPPALQLLTEIKARSESDYVFPSPRRTGRPLREIKMAWRAICEKAKLKDFRIHDLRHSYASILASSGLSLPIIGKLLGHTQAETTKRYAHIQDDVLRAATERVGALVEASEKSRVAEVIPIRGGTS
jgi:integrase